MFEFNAGDRVRILSNDLEAAGVPAGTEGVVESTVPEFNGLLVSVEGYRCPLYGDETIAYFPNEVERV